MKRPFRKALLLMLLVAPVVSCRQDMYDEPRYEPLESSPLFDDGASARPLPPGTVPVGHLRDDDHLDRGLVAGEPAPDLPLTLTPELLARGRRQFNTFCSPCHGAAGYGDGMVARRGFPPPPSFHQPRLRAATPGYLFDVITNGYGIMYSYAARLKPEDRWAVAGYVKALQLSQHARLDDVPESERPRLTEGES